MRFAYPLIIAGLVRLTKRITGSLAGMLEKYDRICLLSHINPDGDAIGSLLGLYWYLRKKGKTVGMAIPNSIPHFLVFLPGSSRIRIYAEDAPAVDRLIGKAQLIICLDFNESDRLGGMLKTFEASEAEKILIDHHPCHGKFTNHVISITGVSSVTEILYMLINAIEVSPWLDKNIAACLFTGIMTDTGCFQFSSSQPQTYLIVARLLKQGIDKDKIYSKVYDNFSAGRMRLMGYALSEKMVVMKDIRTAYITLTRKELKKYSHVTGDTEGFVNLPFSIRGIKVTALLIEKKDQVRLSFRSRGSVDVNRFAGLYFNGGGHRNAAGGESYETMDETVKRFEHLIREFLSER